MKPLSLDFREQLVAAYETGEESLAEIGRRFSVSGKVVGKLVRQKRELGTLAPQVHRRGRKPAVTLDAKARIWQYLWVIESRRSARVAFRGEAIRDEFGVVSQSGSQLANIASG